MSRGIRDARRAPPLRRCAHVLRALAFASALSGSVATPVLAAPVSATAPVSGVHIDTAWLDAPGVSPAALRVRVILPPGYRADAARGYATLYVNDGQDVEAVELVRAVEALAASHEIDAPIVVAVDMPADRMGAYGFSDRRGGHAVVAPTRYGDVGRLAHVYSEWLVRAVVPYVDAHYRTRPVPAARAILGWSLGGVHAFNVGWQYPGVFGRVGAFSPSLWLSTGNADASDVQRTRIAQRMVDAGPPLHPPAIFLAVGTDEETDDRDGDGRNDALDDVVELVEGWQADAGGLKGLRQVGYRVGADAATRGCADAALLVLEGGVHRQSSWARMLPAFLRWAYAPPRTTACSE